MGEKKRNTREIKGKAIQKDENGGATMKRRKSMLSVLMTAAMMCTLFTGCGQDGGSGGSQAADQKGILACIIAIIPILPFPPELDAIFPTALSYLPSCSGHGTENLPYGFTFICIAHSQPDTPAQ